MTRNLFIYMLCGVTLIISCKQEDKNQALIQKDTIQYSNQKFDIFDKRYEKDSALQSEYSLVYPVITEKLDPKVLQQINASIYAFILDSTKPVFQAPNIQQQAKNFFTEYDQAYADYPRNTSWLMDKKIAIEAKVGPLITLSYSISSYTGGAHPNSYTFYSIFDLTNGNKVNLFSIIDSSQIATLNKIRLAELNQQKNELLPDGDWKSYMFPEAFTPQGAFNTNTNIILTKDTLSFYYNSYDIAAYAFGPTLLKIPFRKIKPILLKNTPYYQYLVGA